MPVINYPSVQSGIANAANFAFGCAGPGCPAPLICDNAIPVVASPLVAQSMTVSFGYTTTCDGIVFYPLALLTPINVGTDGNGEAVTPLSVTGNQSVVYDGVSFTADFADVHGRGDKISSATFGLQEALNYMGLQGGGKVAVDQTWKKLGGTDAIYAAAVLPAGVTKVDNR